jgi:hypothetical protein
MVLTCCPVDKTVGMQYGDGLIKKIYTLNSSASNSISQMLDIKKIKHKECSNIWS